MNTFSTETQTQLSEILEGLGKTLDITEKQYQTIVSSYEAVGGWLSAPDSVLSPFKPEIIAQGSFMLGTMIPPSNGKDEIDIDLVCRLNGKKLEWTQHDLKQIVGQRLKAHKTYGKMLDEEGRRCWTLNYSDSARYHMDILPSLVDQNYNIVLEKALSSYDLVRAKELAIRITDNQEANYWTTADPRHWPKSNPFGYGIWFFEIAKLQLLKAYALNEAIQSIPKYQENKYPLQRVVQILKWHRDQFFNGDNEKPISIIITTLAARAYQKQTDLTLALREVVSGLTSKIEERYDAKRGRFIKWIPNPVNDEENFADKWPDNPNLEKKFYKWVGQLQQDLESIFAQVGHGYYRIQEAMERPFGQKVVREAFNNLGERARTTREGGNLKMAAATGIIGEAGRTMIRNHNNFGANE